MLSPLGQCYLPPSTGPTAYSPGYGFTALILACVEISSGPQNVLMYSSTARISAGVSISSYAIIRRLKAGGSYSFPPRKTIS